MQVRGAIRRSGETGRRLVGGYGARWGREGIGVGAFEVVGDGLVEAREQVPVAVEGYGDGGVAEAFLDDLWVGADLDGERDGGVS